MSVYIIIGKNFGDEGKGLATDYFAFRSLRENRRCLVIRHNGGGQAGHTVDFPDKRFVFHQLSSGSFRNADTYWSETFLPDLYKLNEETEDFSKLHNRLPEIHGNPMCRCVYIDDVLVNMALENSRGDNRHGSCGMGINESVERSSFPCYTLHLKDICNTTPQALYQKLSLIRKEYLPQRLKQLGLTSENTGEYGELLNNENVLINAADQMYRTSKLIKLSEDTVINSYDDIIFEGAQGLLLDENYHFFAPHLTSSKTGLHNPLNFVRQNMHDIIPEIVYVSRSYVTRHGAGPLPYEEMWNSHKFTIIDSINIPNAWQGKLRFAPHGTKDEFFTPLLQDLHGAEEKCTLSCMVTHLNETNDRIYSFSGEIFVKEWFNKSQIDKIYLSSTPYAEDIEIL